MDSLLSKKEIIRAIDNAFRELESQKYALDQSAIVAITDIKGNIIYVNEKFCNISKYNEEELIGKNHRIINSGHHPKSFFVDMWKTICSGNVWKDDIKNKAKDGSYYWVATTITPFLDENKVPTMFVSIRFDITKQKELELELAEKLNERTQMIDHLGVQNKQLEDFCYIISHNLRAPLSNMTMLTDLLTDSKIETDTIEYISKLKRVTDYLQETFDELVSAIQVRKDFEIEFEKINLKDAFERACVSLQGQIMEYDAEISCDFSQLSHLNYPKKYIDSIMINLLSNSLKYKSLKRKPVITVSSHSSNGWNCLEFRDNGLGLDMQRHGSKLFMLRKTFHKHPQAKGFGLFITKTQIESTGGRIEVESTLDKDFIVKIYLNKH